MAKAVGAMLLVMQVFNVAVRAVVYVGSITYALISNVELSLPKKNTLSYICILFLETGLFGKLLVKVGNSLFWVIKYKNLICW